MFIQYMLQWMVLVLLGLLCAWVRLKIMKEEKIAMMKNINKIYSFLNQRNVMPCSYLSKM